MTTLVLLIALVVGSTYWQTWAVAGLKDRQDNAIERVAQFKVKRGLILAQNGAVLALLRPWLLRGVRPARAQRREPGGAGDLRERRLPAGLPALDQLRVLQH